MDELETTTIHPHVILVAAAPARRVEYRTFADDGVE